MPERSADWMKQAKRDLEAARRMAEEAFFEWSCFAAQRAAEKAVKAVFQKFGGLARGHLVFRLLWALKTKVNVDEELLDCGRTLDKFYIPARYPNGFQPEALSNISRKRRRTMHSFVREASWNSVKVFWLERDKLLKALRKEAERIGRENQAVKKIVLFGSLAEGRAVPGSDVDLLIVLAESDKPFLERVAEWSAKIKIDFPVEVFPYTQEELETPLARTALETGLTVFERP